MSKARLEEFYKEKIVPELKKKFKYKNVMEVPKISKIVLNVGVKDAVSDTKSLNAVTSVVQQIVGQRPVRTIAKKSIAGFKLREGMPIGVKVTLRRNMMYEFLDRLINLALPKVRDFRGVPTKFDRRGNYNLGIKEWTIFPEVDYDTAGKVHGMNITIHTSAKEDKEGFELLKAFGMPFKKQAENEPNAKI